MAHALKTAAFATALVFSSTIAAQIVLPPHNNTYNGFTRGYNFISSIPFLITALELPPDAQQMGDTASFLVRINGSTVLHNIGGSNAQIATNIMVNVGDSVDILGNWSPAVANNFSAHNSYTLNYNLPGYSTMIQGVPHDLRRAGWQWDIGDPTWVGTGATGVYVAPAAGQLGRIFIYTAPSGSGTLGTYTITGAGCGRAFASFYQFFPQPVNYDLDGIGFTISPGSSNTAIVAQLGAMAPVGSLGGTVTNLTLGDDAEVFYPFTVGSYPGWTGLAVNSNGSVARATGNALAGGANVTNLLSNPNTAVYWQCDLDPSTLGLIQVEETASLTTVTWTNVPSWNNSSTSNNFQFQFYSNGEIVMVGGAMATVGSNGGVIVGYSPGGPNLDSGSVDLSALTGALFLSPSNLPDTPAMSLTSGNRPRIGFNWNLAVASVPPSGTIGIEVFGLSDPGFNDLAFLGLPGCGLRASLDYLNPWLAFGAVSHVYHLSIPSNMTLVGTNIYTTAVTFVPGLNPFGAATANGIAGLIGTY